MNKDNYCVIMAGGVGSRFWPLSRTSRPKQFLDILGTGKTLLQQTFERFRTVVPSENIFIVTNIDYRDLVFEQLPSIKPNQVLLEPMRKNTAPCIAYANYKILQSNPDANIIVAPSDHLIIKEEEFANVLRKGLDFVKTSNSLLTLGIPPSRPETGYGYIQVNGDKGILANDKSFKKVKTFTEKPDFEMAKVFYESGEFFWNSGIFIWSLKTIMNAYTTHLSEINTLFCEGMGFYNTEKEMDFINDVYPKCKSISIDYGIMEKADNVHVLCSDFGWSDLGTWGSLYENSEKDVEGNAINGENVFSYNLKNCIVNMPNDKLAVIHGLEDFIVVESEGTLLICKKQDEQRIKQFVNDVKIKKGESII
jgi:mannose-1-phosphate guanylyltransferase